MQTCVEVKRDRSVLFFACMHMHNLTVRTCCGLACPATAQGQGQSSSSTGDDDATDLNQKTGRSQLERPGMRTCMPRHGCLRVCAVGHMNRARATTHAAWWRETSKAAAARGTETRKRALGSRTDRSTSSRAKIPHKKAGGHGTRTRFWLPCCGAPLSRSRCRPVDLLLPSAAPLI